MSDEELQQMMDPGMGFMSAPLNEPQKAAPTSESDEDNVTEERDARGKTVWYDEPTFDDQHEKFPTTCRLVGPQMAVFNIADPAQLDSLNKLMLKQQPKEAPGIVLINKKENFFQGTWLMSVEYFKVQYKKLLSIN